MKLLWKAKDGGPESRVWAWGLESKRFGSILILKFARGTRDAYHGHAFNAISWVLSGGLIEHLWYGVVNHYSRSWQPIITRRETVHQVHGVRGANWVLSFRGAWRPVWEEIVLDERITLTYGRKRV